MSKLDHQKKEKDSILKKIALGLSIIGGIIVIVEFYLIFINPRPNPEPIPEQIHPPVTKTIIGPSNNKSSVTAHTLPITREGRSITSVILRKLIIVKTSQVEDVELYIDGKKQRTNSHRYSLDISEGGHEVYAQYTDEFNLKRIYKDSINISKDTTLLIIRQDQFH